MMARLPIWHAMSDLFLDTELQETDYRYIARQLAASGKSPSELRLIFDTEVVPAFSFNLVDPAGVWSGWAEPDVMRIMSRYFAEGPLLPVETGYLNRFAEQAWRALTPYLSSNRNS
jgi:hypothetical protein